MEIPEDILVEILVRLPADSLMRFKCVSKLWSSLISSRSFTNLFFKFSSSTNPKRRVFVYCNNYRQLFSSLATSSFLQLNPDPTLFGNRMQNRNYLLKRDGFCNSALHFVNAIRGLMCFRDKRVIRIINFTTRQILILPQVESNILLQHFDGVMGTCGSMMGRSPYSPSMWNYLGYDPVNDEYKVLITISKVTKVTKSKRTWGLELNVIRVTEEINEVRSETQVLVLGAGASWRNTKSLTSPPPIHSPSHLTSLINSVLYYGALSHDNIFVLMSFDFSSEEYNLMEFPMEAGIRWNECWNMHYKYYLLVNLMNYQDQVAVFNGSRLANESILDLWVLEDAGKKGKWSHKFFVLPCLELRSSLVISDLKIRGTGRNGEITLCGGCRSRGRIKYFVYDLERNHTIRVVVIEPLFIDAGFETNFWDDFESIMYLEP